MTFISPNDDIETRDLMDSIVQTTIKQSPRLRPKFERPRKIPLNSQPKWTTTKKMMRNNENQVRVFQPTPKPQEEEPVEEQNTEEILEEIFRRAEEEEEEEKGEDYIESAGRKRQPYYFQGLDYVQRSVLPSIEANPDEYQYGIDQIEEESQSES